MASQTQAAVRGYLEKLQQECQEKQYTILQARKLAVAEQLQAEPYEVQISFLKTAFGQAADLSPFQRAGGETVLGRMLSGLLSTKPAGRRLNWLEFRALGNVASSLLRGKLPFHPEDLAEIVCSAADNLQHIHHSFSLVPLVGAAESRERSAAIESAMGRLREALAHVTRHTNSKENRKLIERIDRYLTPGDEGRLLPGGPWSSAVLTEIAKQSESTRSDYFRIFHHCLATPASIPSKAWRKRAEELVAVIGPGHVRNSALRWLDRGAVPLTASPGTQIQDKDADYIKGFVWFLAAFSDGELCRAIADLGLACLRKIPNIGPVSARTGFACVNVLAEMPGMEPVSQLSRMRVKVKYVVGLKLIEKALNGAAERAGLQRDDLEDMAVPDYELDAAGKSSHTLGDCTADLILVAPGSEVELHWKNAQGKAVKAPPQEVKRDHAARVKEIKRAAADIQKMLMAQRLRIEHFLIHERKMGYEHWREHFLAHPVLSAIAKRLIWGFETNGRIDAGIWLDGEIVDWNSQPLSDLGPTTMVQLWHPLQSDPQTIFSWRCWLEDHQVIQPFKQAHREVYILTPAEEQTETYSNRFAAHVIRQHQFASLCREREWQYRLMGSGFDGGNVPTLEVPRRSMKAEFWVEVPEASDGVSGSGIDLYLLTDQVRFYREGGQIRLADVPPLVFSEIMRDVDLFVGVTSIGNDPTWGDRGEQGYGQYWNSFAFGDLGQSGETRRAILEKLLPKLKISSRCRLEGKFLIVRGDLHDYKIHLGSANVMMEPGSHYLCIVASRGVGDRESGPLYLPFDGDNTLAIILSKAFLLAADTKITDETILRQIRRPGTPAQ
jgi:hypothetical protein